MVVLSAPGTLPSRSWQPPRQLAATAFFGPEAWDDAGQEFARLWDFHMPLLRGLCEELLGGGSSQARKPDNAHHVIQESGFSRLGLLFALDYAFFWKRRKDPDKALATLRAAVLRMNIDDDYEDLWEPTPLDPKDLGKHPQQLPVQFGFGTGYGEPEPVGSVPRSFCGWPTGNSKTAGQESAAGGNAGKGNQAGQESGGALVGAIVCMRARTEEALNLELAYLKIHPRLDAMTRAQHRAQVYEDFQKPAEAAVEYEKALAAMTRKPKDEVKYLRDEVLARLLALYAALGQTQKVLDLSLRQFDLGQPVLSGPWNRPNRCIARRGWKPALPSG